MKIPHLTALIIAASTLGSFAGTLESTFEGDARLRDRLQSIQDSPSPPPLQVSGWINGEFMTLEDLKGKIVVLDFWATWCGPCISSIPHTIELQKWTDSNQSSS